MKYHEEPAPWDDGEYNTGRTTPPKSHRGIIALLLIAVILLIGLSTLLGFSSLRLFQQLNEQRAAAETICYGTAEEPTVAGSLVPIDAVQETVAVSAGPAPEADGTLSLQDIYVKCIPSVVSITTQSRGGSATGTGVIASQDGYIVTNYHVIEGGESYTVQLTDDRVLSAGLVGSDPTSDLAVLHIDADGLTSAEFGDSDVLRVGDSVVAIGDPLGVEYRGTMTNGIVSAINRNVNVNGRAMNLIQTNAALNSGNSGGPLINSMGQVIGINTMKIGAFADSSGVEGLGFAIPSATVQEIVNQLLTQGYVSGRPWLGIEGESFSTFYQRFYRIPRGVYITSVQSGSPAGTAGLQSGDIIVSVDGTAVSDMEDLDSLLYAHIPGDTMTLTIYRSGRQGDVTVTLTEKQQ